MGCLAGRPGSLSWLGVGDNFEPFSDDPSDLGQDDQGLFLTLVAQLWLAVGWVWSCQTDDLCPVRLAFLRQIGCVRLNYKSGMTSFTNHRNLQITSFGQIASDAWPAFDLPRIDRLVVTSRHNVKDLLGGYSFGFFAAMDANGHSRYLPMVIYQRGQPDHLAIGSPISGHRPMTRQILWAWRIIAPFCLIHRFGPTLPSPQNTRWFR